MAAANGRRNPEHPPYALMIVEAIRELCEDEGSTEESISRVIKPHQDQLPPGHDRLLPYYLNKYNVISDFIKRPDGRYALAHAAAEEEKVVVVEKVLESRRRKRVGSKDEDCTSIKESHEEQEEKEEEVHVPLSRPRKAQNVDDEGVPMDCEGDLVMEVRAEESPKRRGRPPKKSPMRKNKNWPKA